MSHRRDDNKQNKLLTPEEFWERSIDSMNINEETSVIMIEAYTDILFQELEKKKKIPKDDLGFLSINYVYLPEEDTFKFDLTFSPNENFDEDEESDDYEEPIFSFLFHDELELLKGIRKFIPFYSKYISNNSVQF